MLILAHNNLLTYSETFIKQSLIEQPLSINKYFSGQLPKTCWQNNQTELHVAKVSQRSVYLPRPNNQKNVRAYHLNFLKFLSLQLPKLKRAVL